ncbi:terminase large subunit domain-containing protein [Rhizobium sp. RAF56]|uniref:terminase large subunit domain-containing protein n=1 Tax=Rhizobium sp. RAF56 TaxID=3233062 RepID=UPI003F9D4B7C
MNSIQNPWHFSWQYEAKDLSEIGKKPWSRLSAKQREDRLDLITDGPDFLIFENLHKSDTPAVQALVAGSTGPDMFRLIHAARRGLDLTKLSLEALRGVDIDFLADSVSRALRGEKVDPIVPLQAHEIPPYTPRKNQGRRNAFVSAPARRKLIERQVRVHDRPWKLLSELQKTQRLDKLGAWHERDLFTKDLGKHESERIRKLAENSTEAEMLKLVRAYKAGLALSVYTLKKLRALDIDNALESKTLKTLPKGKVGKAVAAIKSLAGDVPGSQPAFAPIIPPEPAPEPDAADQDLKAFERSLLDLASKVSGVKPRTKQPAAPPREQRERSPRSPLFHPREPPQEAQGRVAAAPRVDAPPMLEPAPDPLDSAQRSAAAGERAAEALGIDQDGKAITRKNFPGYSKAEIAAIRSKLVVGGRTRLDLEAISAYMLVPSYFAIATGLDPAWWQAALLDCYDRRVGCLAARQSGKSLVTARKATCFALTNPGSTSLIIAPTLRQSSELLMKCVGVAQVAGLKLGSLSQFQMVIADKQVGASSRIISLPGSNEDAGASVRGYSADLLIFEEAAFLQDPVISAVLPSIAARPKAQLIGISSAGIIGSYFHSVMTAAGSKWSKLVVPADQSDRFTEAQLEEMRVTLGARYPVEMLCKWGTVGDSLYSEDVLDIAFGTTIDGTSHRDAALDPELAFGHLDLEQLFTARPFERDVA